MLLAKPQRSKFSIGPEPVANEAVYIPTPKKIDTSHKREYVAKS
jgi:hypothetical protein